MQSHQDCCCAVPCCGVLPCAVLSAHVDIVDAAADVQHCGHAFSILNYLHDDD